jgi:hypothetical protein
VPPVENFVEGYIAGREKIGSLSGEKKWCIFFKYKNEEKAAGLIQELCEGDEGIMRANESLQKLSRDKEQWARAIFREKAAKDYRSEISASRQVGYDQGEAIGFQKGEAIGIRKGEAIGVQKGEAIERERSSQEKQEFIKKLRAAGVSEAQIAVALSEKKGR